MPYFFPACIEDSIWCTLLSRISARIAGVHTMISGAITRPRPLAFWSSVWVITPSSTNASCARTCGCWCDGNTSMMRLMLSIAEFVCLVFATLHTNSAMESINRIIDVFPSHQQPQVRAQLAFVLEGVITQTLLQKSKGRGRVMAPEIMVCTPAIRALIRDNKVHQIESSMQAGKKYGMQTLNDSLYQLYMTRQVAKEECLRAAPNANDFLRMIGEPLLDESEPLGPAGHGHPQPGASKVGTRR